jgi:hypothetical protein
MIQEPDTPSLAHWHAEVRAWIDEVDRLSARVGMRTAADVKKSVALWKRQLGAIYGEP